MVILIPLFRKLAESGRLDLLMRPYGPAIFTDQTYIGRSFSLNHPNRGRGGIVKLLFSGHRRELGRILAAEKYDEIIIYTQERPVIREWIETWRDKDSVVRLMTYPELDPDRVSIGAKSLGLDPGELEKVPRLDVHEEAREAARLRLNPLGQRVLAVQPGAGHNKRQAKARALPAVTWADLLAYILQNNGADSAVLHGSRDQSKASDEIISAMPGELRSSVRNWCGKAGLAELIPLLAESEALLSVDTGPAHIAAAVGTPLLVVVGPASPESYLPKGKGLIEYVTAGIECQYCMGTPRLKKCKDYRCMKMVSPDMLIQAWLRMESRKNA